LAVSTDFEIDYGQLRKWTSHNFYFVDDNNVIIYSNAIFVYVLDQQSNAQ